MFHDTDNSITGEPVEDVSSRFESQSPRSTAIASVGVVEVDVAGTRLRLPMPGDEPLVVGPLIVRVIDLGDGAFMHEIRNAR